MKLTRRLSFLPALGIALLLLVGAITLAGHNAGRCRESRFCSVGAAVSQDAKMETFRGISVD